MSLNEKELLTLKRVFDNNYHGDVDHRVSEKEYLSITTKLQSSTKAQKKKPKVIDYIKDFKSYKYYFKMSDGTTKRVDYCDYYNIKNNLVILWGRKSVKVYDIYGNLKNEISC